RAHARSISANIIGTEWPSETRTRAAHHSARVRVREGGVNERRTDCKTLGGRDSRRRKRTLANKGSTLEIGRFVLTFVRTMACCGLQTVHFTYDAPTFTPLQCGFDSRCPL